MDSIDYEHFSAALNQYDKELDEIYHKYATQHHLSDAALWILYAIYDAKDGITQTDLCNAWSFCRQTINTALKKLEQQEIIALRAVSTNRKSKEIVFTPKGNAMVQEVLVPLMHAEYNVYNAFSEEENKLFIELCKKRCTLLHKFLGKK